MWGHWSSQTDPKCINWRRIHGATEGDSMLVKRLAALIVAVGLVGGVVPATALATEAPSTHEETDLVLYPTEDVAGSVIFNSSAGNPNNLEMTVKLRNVT